MFSNRRTHPAANSNVRNRNRYEEETDDDSTTVGGSVGETESPAMFANQAEMEIALDENDNFVSLGNDSAEAISGPSEIADQVDAFDVARFEPSMTVTKWIEGLTRAQNGIGGVHAGRVCVAFYLNQEGYVQIQWTRQNMEILSGQMYMPYFKQLFQKNTIRKQTKLAALPAMIQELLSSTFLNSTAEKSNLPCAVSELLDFALHFFAHGDKFIESTKGSNTVRFEYFFSTSFSTVDPDVVVPCVNPYDCLYVSNDNNFFLYYQSLLREISLPLRKVFIDQQGGDYNCLSAEAKTMLVLQSEILIIMLEMHPFSGKAYSQINRILQSLNSNCVFWHVPAESLTASSQRDKDMTGNDYGLVSKILKIPCDPENNVERPAANDNIRSLPAHVQMYQGLCNSRKVILPNVFHKLCGQFFGCCFAAYHTPADPGDDPLEMGYFDVPSFSAIATLPREIAEKLVTNACKLIANAHDFKWRHLMNARTVKSHTANQRGVLVGERAPPPAIAAVEDFPTTILSFQSDPVFSEHFDIAGYFSSGNSANVIKCPGT